MTFLLRSRPRIFWSAAFLGAACVLLLPLPVLHAGGFDEEAETCLSCHGDKEASATLGDGSAASVYVNAEDFEKSVHKKKVLCSDCHPGQKEYPHPEVQAGDARLFQATFQDACKKCHQKTYDKYLDGVHHRAHTKGDLMAPYCFDCHGAHTVSKPGNPKSKISETCSSCHSDVYAVYEKSVHGTALLEGGNNDAPVCTDCHSSHDTADPGTIAFRLQSPDLCGKCHSDEEKMQRYGLSTNVLKTYTDDFHGMSAELYGHQKSKPQKIVQVCYDCHGIHDITRAHGEGSKVLKSNLVKTCRKCHPNASENFSSAWLSHYEPSLKHAPLVYSVKIFYRIFIPFVIGGLVFQMGLHMFRWTRKRK